MAYIYNTTHTLHHHTIYPSHHYIIYQRYHQTIHSLHDISFAPHTNEPYCSNYIIHHMHIASYVDCIIAPCINHIMHLLQHCTIHLLHHISITQCSDYKTNPLHSSRIICQLYHIHITLNVDCTIAPHVHYTIHNISHTHYTIR